MEQQNQNPNPAENQGNQKNEKTFTQEELTKIAAKEAKSGEKKGYAAGEAAATASTRAAMLSELGMDEDGYKAYLDAKKQGQTEGERLKAAEKKLLELETANSAVKTQLAAELSDAQGIITALAKVSGKTVDEVGNIVKMAKGLVGDGVTMENAIDTVLGMITKDTKTPPQKDPNVPAGVTVVQPDNAPNESTPKTLEEAIAQKLKGDKSK
jgi:hypothetical protein